ncbi:unnamed protein product [Trichobilharzia regenti]|nr:unnamed protein product [Trichobilharzia regenti]
MNASNNEGMPETAAKRHRKSREVDSDELDSGSE